MSIFQLFEGIKFVLQSSDHFSYIGNFVGYILRYSRKVSVHGFAFRKAKPYENLHHLNLLNITLSMVPSEKRENRRRCEKNAFCTYETNFFDEFDVFKTDFACV